MTRLFRWLFFALALTLTSPFTKTVFATVADCGACRNDYVANGVTTTFAYSFKVQSKNDLIVYIDSTIKTVDTDYTVNNVGNGSGGSIIFKIAPSNLARVAIVRNPALSQASSYPQGGGFSGVRVETDFDKLAIGLQALREAYNRSLRFAPYSNKNSSNLGLYLPDPVAQKCLGWNSTASAIVNNDCSGTGGGTGDAVTLQGRNIASTAPNNGQVLTWNTSSNEWQPSGTQTIANTVYNNQANTYTAGTTQIFPHDATNSGLNVAPVAGDPSSPQDGDIWYNSTLGKFRKREAGSTTNLDTTGGTPAFSDITAATNTNALVIGTGGSLATSGSGTIAATTAAALASTPTLCTTGQAATGVVANGNATGCAAFFAQRTITAADTGITITNGNGVSGNPTIALGALAVKTNASNTITTGDQDFGSASSFKVPTTAGAAPTANGRLAYDSTANRYKFGANGSTITIPTLAEIQPLNANLTALAAISGANNIVPIFSGAGAITTGLLPSCADSGGNHLNYDSTTHAFSCGTSSTGGLAGAAAGQFLEATGATSFGGSANLSQSGGVVNAANGFTVGNVSANYLALDTSAVTGAKTWTVPNVSGTVRTSTGALTAGNMLTVDANGQIVDGGAPGTGTWTDSSTSTGTNKTLDFVAAAAANTITLPLQAYWDGGSMTPDGTNCTDATRSTINSGPTGYYFVCADNNASTFDGQVAIPANAGTVATVTMQLTVNDVDSSAQHFYGVFKAMCRASGATVNSTWGSDSAAVDITMTTANVNYSNSPVTVTPNSTCSPGSTLFWRFTINATNHTDNGNARVIGVMMKQTS